MQIGMIGLGRMGANMAERLLAGGHRCVVHDRSAQAIESLASKGAVGVGSIGELVDRLDRPRVIWLMVPAAAVDGLVDGLTSKLAGGDILIDGGNSHFTADKRRAASLSKQGIHYLDVGTSGGVWGRERGYCLMIGGAAEAVDRVAPVFRTLAPGFSSPRTAGNTGEPSPPEQGWLHCGPSGAGHFVKMVHNGIEYGLMAAYAEGFNILRLAAAGRLEASADAETAPLEEPEMYGFDIDVAQVSEVWRRGSVIASWLLDLTAQALRSDPGLERFDGRVSDSGEGRWAALAAIEIGAPAPVLTTALFGRFASRGSTDLPNRLLSAMRWQFGGHAEKGAG